MVILKARIRDRRSSRRRMATPPPAQSEMQDVDQRKHQGNHDNIAHEALVRRIGGDRADHHHPGLWVHPLEQGCVRGGMPWRRRWCGISGRRA